MAIAVNELSTEDVTLEFSRDVIWKLVHPITRTEEERFAPLGSIAFEEGHDPEDGVLRDVVTCHGFTRTELNESPQWSNRLLSDLGLPPYDVFVARSASAEVAMLMAGDAASVLGSLAEVQS
jgi:hypothetical protein